jgi:hypothetical protein
LDAALRSAITEVETALPDVRVVRVEVDRTDLDVPTAAWASIGNFEARGS